MLNGMQKDLLTELVNTYIGQAASYLSEMVNQRITLEIPSVELMSISDFDLDHIRKLNSVEPDYLITSSIRFTPHFTGKALLVFPAEQAKMLVNACLGEQFDLQNEKEVIQLIDTDFDVLKEISNVILNAVIGEFGNLLEVKLEYTLPDIELVQLAESDKRFLLDNEIYILVLHTSFLLADAQVQGLVFIALGMNSVKQLLEKIDEMLGDMSG